MTDEKEPYPGHGEEVRKRAQLEENLTRAHAAVLPGALREAFAGEPTRAEGHTLQPVTTGMAALLARVNSPLLEVVEIMREEWARKEESQPLENAESAKSAPLSQPSPPMGAKESEPSEKGIPQSRNLQTILGRINERVNALKFEEEQIAETIFIFTRPAKRVRQLLDKGRPHFREAAMEAIGDKLHPMQTMVLQHACIQHYAISFATIIGFGSAAPASEGGGGGLNFRVPSPSAVTGSGGG